MGTALAAALSGASVGQAAVPAPSSAGSNLVATPLLPAPASAGGPRFVSQPAARTGVDFGYRWNEAVRYERLFNSSMVGGGVAIGDYDGDGRPDLCLTRPAGGCQLYRNLGDFRFTNVTEQVGIHTDRDWTTGVTFADVNGDGRLDLQVCCYDGPNRIFVNAGNGTFAERAAALGLAFNGASMMAAYADYDRDGDLDCYLLTAGLIPGPAQKFRVTFVNGKPVVPDELQEYWQIFHLPGERAAAAEAAQFDHLYRNNGDGTFTDVTREAGITGCDFGNAVVWWDADGDGWPDLYVANDYFGPDRLYRNHGDGTFREISREALPYTPWTSMGADSADVNNDGLPDLLASDMAGTTHFKRMVDLGDSERSGWFLDLPEPRQYMRNALFLNTGTGRFLEAAHPAGIAHTDWTWSVLLADLDDDGWVDLFVPNGMTRDWMDNDLASQAQKLSPAEFVRFWRAQPVRRDENLAFRNRGGLEFEPVAKSWGLDQPGPSFGAATGDLDGDGQLDLVVNDFEAPPRLYRNTGPAGHRITIRLDGRPPNVWGIGATVRLEAASGRQMRHVTLSRGFMSASEPIAHFGLGDNTQVKQLTVEWPSGVVQRFADLPTDQHYRIREPVPAQREPDHRPAAATWFAQIPAFGAYRQETGSFDDFARERLLPFRLSPPGPGLAWADVDGDGDDDLYVCGTARQAGVLFRNNGGGAFEAVAGTGLGSGVDEMSALFFEANGDGRPDLYVVTGGGASEADAPALRDRLYLNAGNGRFVAAPEDAVPDLRDSGSVAVAADWDRDGDLDLFVGSRSIPGRYPLTPTSRLLRNESGRLVEVTAEVAPGLSHSGLVTGALWTDVDDDGWLDLLVAGEWGPVRLFHNLRGRLVQTTQEAGLEDQRGWWTAIVGGDVDHDGDMDYVVTNFGRGSRYSATTSAPLRLYRGDFDGNGEPELVETQVTPAGELPWRGRSALVGAMPRLAERVPTHRAFASATVPEILGARALAEALMVEVNTLDSGLLLNDGRGRFRFAALPTLAQIAPANGAVLFDADGDRDLDLYLAQNTFSPQREVGRVAGGVGLLLSGDGRGEFTPVWPNRSGLVVPGEGRSVVRADLDGDGREDLVVAVRDGSLFAFRNESPSPRAGIVVRLEDRPGNPVGVGARIEVRYADGAVRMADVQAGGGGLGQSRTALTFGRAAGVAIVRIEVRWPDGEISSHTEGLDGPAVTLRRPATSAAKTAAGNAGASVPRVAEIF